jgi:hypothetical protein
MYVTDVNGDGRPDVITSIKAHSYGLSWFEQNKDGSFAEHVILGKTKEDNADGKGFSQIHAIQLEDINGDGLPDIVCGKRRWAHGIKGDDEPNADPVLNWFELTPPHRQRQRRRHPVLHRQGEPGQQAGHRHRK